MYLQREDSKVVGRSMQLHHNLKTTADFWIHNKCNPLSLDLFVGQLKSSLTCTACGFRSTMFDPFWDLSIPIAQVSTHIDFSKVWADHQYFIKDYRLGCEVLQFCLLLTKLSLPTEELRRSDSQRLFETLHKRGRAGWRRAAGEQPHHTTLHYKQ